MADSNEITLQPNQKLSNDEAIINSVVSDLGDLPALTKLLNSQLHAITEETERSAYFIMERLQAIDGVINDLTSTITSGLHKSKDIIESSEKNFGTNVDLIANFISGNVTILKRDEELLAHLSDTSSTLSSMFMDVLGNIQFQDVTRQQIEHVQNALTQLDTHVAQMVEMMRSRDFSSSASIKEHIDQIYNSYVMKNQRDVHETVMSNNTQVGDTAASQKIELF